jgi:hypothetical protein
VAAVSAGAKSGSDALSISSNSCVSLILPRYSACRSKSGDARGAGEPCRLVIGPEVEDATTIEFARLLAAEIGPPLPGYKTQPG